MAQAPDNMTKNQFPLFRGEQLITCVYDKSHKILDGKFMLHLRKCRGNYLKRQAEEGLPVEIEVCMYDYSHHIPTALMPAHIAEVGGNCKTALANGFIKKSES